MESKSIHCKSCSCLDCLVRKEYERRMSERRFREVSSLTSSISSWALLKLKKLKRRRNNCYYFGTKHIRSEIVTPNFVKLSLSNNLYSSCVSYKNIESQDIKAPTCDRMKYIVATDKEPGRFQPNQLEHNLKENSINGKSDKCSKIVKYHHEKHEPISSYNSVSKTSYPKNNNLETLSNNTFGAFLTKTASSRRKFSKPSVHKHIRSRHIESRLIMQWFFKHTSNEKRHQNGKNKNPNNIRRRKKNVTLKSRSYDTVICVKDSSYNCNTELRAITPDIIRGHDCKPELGAIKVIAPDVKEQHGYKKELRANEVWTPDLTDAQFDKSYNQTRKNKIKLKTVQELNTANPGKINSALYAASSTYEENSIPKSTKKVRFMIEENRRENKSKEHRNCNSKQTKMKKTRSIKLEPSRKDNILNKAFINTKQILKELLLKNEDIKEKRQRKEITMKSNKINNSNSKSRQIVSTQRNLRIRRTKKVYNMGIKRNKQMINFRNPNSSSQDVYLSKQISSHKIVLEEKQETCQPSCTKYKAQDVKACSKDCWSPKTIACRKKSPWNVFDQIVNVLSMRLPYCRRPVSPLLYESEVSATCNLIKVNKYRPRSSPVIKSSSIKSTATRFLNKNQSLILPPQMKSILKRREGDESPKIKVESRHSEYTDQRNFDYYKKGILNRICLVALNKTSSDLKFRRNQEGIVVKSKKEKNLSEKHVRKNNNLNHILTQQSNTQSSNETTKPGEFNVGMCIPSLCDKRVKINKHLSSTNGDPQIMTFKKSPTNEGNTFSPREIECLAHSPNDRLFVSGFCNSNCNKGSFQYVDVSFRDKRKPGVKSSMTQCGQSKSLKFQKYEKENLYAHRRVGLGSKPYSDANCCVTKTTRNQKRRSTIDKQKSLRCILKADNMTNVIDNRDANSSQTHTRKHRKSNRKHDKHENQTRETKCNRHSNSDKQIILNYFYPYLTNEHYKKKIELPAGRIKSTYSSILQFYNKPRNRTTKSDETNVKIKHSKTAREIKYSKQSLYDLKFSKEAGDHKHNVITKRSRNPKDTDMVDERKGLGPTDMALRIRPDKTRKSKSLAIFGTQKTHLKSRKVYSDQIHNETKSGKRCNHRYAANIGKYVIKYSQNGQAMGTRSSLCFKMKSKTRTSPLQSSTHQKDDKQKLKISSITKEVNGQIGKDLSDKSKESCKKQQLISKSEGHIDKVKSTHRRSFLKGCLSFLTNLHSKNIKYSSAAQNIKLIVMGETNRYDKKFKNYSTDYQKLLEHHDRQCIKKGKHLKITQNYLKSKISQGTITASMRSKPRLKDVRLHVRLDNGDQGSVIYVPDKKDPVVSLTTHKDKDRILKSISTMASKNDVKSVRKQKRNEIDTPSIRRSRVQLRDVKSFVLEPEPKKSAQLRCSNTKAHHKKYWKKINNNQPPLVVQKGRFGFNSKTGCLSVLDNQGSTKKSRPKSGRALKLKGNTKIKHSPDKKQNLEPKLETIPLHLSIFKSDPIKILSKTLNDNKPGKPVKEAFFKRCISFICHPIQYLRVFRKCKQSSSATLKNAKGSLTKCSGGTITSSATSKGRVRNAENIKSLEESEPKFRRYPFECSTKMQNCKKQIHKIMQVTETSSGRRSTVNQCEFERRRLHEFELKKHVKKIWKKHRGSHVKLNPQVRMNVKKSKTYPEMVCRILERKPLKYSRQTQSVNFRLYRNSDNISYAFMKSAPANYHNNKPNLFSTTSRAVKSLGPFRKTLSENLKMSVNRVPSKWDRSIVSAPIILNKDIKHEKYHHHEYAYDIEPDLEVTGTMNKGTTKKRINELERNNKLLKTKRNLKLGHIKRYTKLNRIQKHTTFMNFENNASSYHYHDSTKKTESWRLNRIIVSKISTLRKLYGANDKSRKNENIRTSKHSNENSFETKSFHSRHATDDIRNISNKKGINNITKKKKPNTLQKYCKDKSYVEARRKNKIYNILYVQQETFRDLSHRPTNEEQPKVFKSSKNDSELLNFKRSSQTRRFSSRRKKIQTLPQQNNADGSKISVVDLPLKECGSKLCLSHKCPYKCKHKSNQKGTYRNFKNHQSFCSDLCEIDVIMPYSRKKFERTISHTKIIKYRKSLLNNISRKDKGSKHCQCCLCTENTKKMQKLDINQEITKQQTLSQGEKNRFNNFMRKKGKNKMSLNAQEVTKVYRTLNTIQDIEAEWMHEAKRSRRNKRHTTVSEQIQNSNEKELAVHSKKESKRPKKQKPKSFKSHEKKHKLMAKTPIEIFIEKVSKEVLKKYTEVLQIMLGKQNKPRRVNCGEIYILTLRHRPCSWIYNKCSWIYPYVLNILKIIKDVAGVFLFLTALLIWTPCIFLTELCRASFCCAVCTR